jgi:hypothetical protein
MRWRQNKNSPARVQGRASAEGRRSHHHRATASHSLVNNSKPRDHHGVVILAYVAYILPCSHQLIRTSKRFIVPDLWSFINFNPVTCFADVWTMCASERVMCDTGGDTYDSGSMHESKQRLLCMAGVS